MHFIILKERFVKQWKRAAQQTVSFTPLSLSANDSPDDRTDTTIKPPAVCHSLPGLAITKGIYIIVLTTDALLPAELTLLFWTLPERSGNVWACARTIPDRLSQIECVLTGPVYAVLFSPNAS